MNSIEIEPKEQLKSLVNSTLDPWLLGGFSLLIYMILVLSQTTFIGEVPQVKRHVNNIGATFTMLTLFVNFPHFIWSYKLAYSQPFSFIKRNYFQLILVPIALCFLFTIAFLFWSTSLPNSNLSKLITAIFGSVGLNNIVSRYPNLGTQILGILFTFQFAIVGWHYVKQTFGAMITYSYYENYNLEKLQKNILKLALFGIWWVFFLKSNIDQRTYSSFDVSYYSLELPISFLFIAKCYLIITFLAVLYTVFFSIYKKNKKFPPVCVIIPFISMYLWFPPFDFLFIASFFSLVVPFAHSLQYLCFVYKVEKESGVKFSPNRQKLRGIWLMASIVIGGFFIIEILPPILDKATSSGTITSIGFFVAAFQIFINVHHYFIDNAIWQSKNKEVKGLLF